MEEEQRLLGGEGATRVEGRIDAYNPFITMSSAFALVISVNTVVASYSSSIFGIRLVSFAAAIGNITQTTTSLFIAAPIIEAFGPLKAVIFGLSGILVHIVLSCIAQIPRVYDDHNAVWGTATLRTQIYPRIIVTFNF